MSSIHQFYTFSPSDIQHQSSVQCCSLLSLYESCNNHKRVNKYGVHKTLFYHIFLYMPDKRVASSIYVIVCIISNDTFNFHAKYPVDIEKELEFLNYIWIIERIRNCILNITDEIDIDMISHSLVAYFRYIVE